MLCLVVYPAVSKSRLEKAYLPNTELHDFLFPLRNKAIVLTNLSFNPLGETGGTLTMGISKLTSQIVGSNIGLMVIVGKIPVNDQRNAVATEKRYFCHIDLSKSEINVDIFGNLILKDKSVWCYLFKPIGRTKALFQKGFSLRSF